MYYTNKYSFHLVHLVQSIVLKGYRQTTPNGTNGKLSNEANIGRYNENNLTIHETKNVPTTITLLHTSKITIT